MIKSKIAKIQEGCGKILSVISDYDGKMVICGKYGKQLCPECQAELKGITETRDEILKLIDEFDFFSSKAFDEQVYCGSGDIKDWEEFFKLLREELKEKIK